MIIPSPREMEALLATHRDVNPIPELDAATPARLRATADGKEALAWAQGLCDEPIPLTPYTLFREFRRTGARDSFQDVYFWKRTLLSATALACWLGEDDTRLDHLCDLIWDVCEETKWVLPAHEGPVWGVDLFAAESASEFAHILHLLGDRLPWDIIRRVKDEVEQRVFRNYLGSAGFFGYDKVEITNWTGVCFGSMGEAALLLDARSDIQAEIVSVAARQIIDYFERAFTEDGASTEGISYWNYGLLHAVTFCEMLRMRTGGEIDLLSHPRVSAIARYPLFVNLGGNHYANFADASETATLSAFITTRLAARTRTPELAAMGQQQLGARFGNTFYNLLWAGNRPHEVPKQGHRVLPSAGLVRCAAETSGRPLILIAKAGHNDEHHNHNDVGSFVLHVGNTTYLCDPGPGLYSRDYFLAATRYDNAFLQSYTHSVPVVGGQQQPYGRQYAGTLSVESETQFTLDLAGAYPCSDLSRLSRRFTLAEDGTVVMEDDAVFEGVGQTLQEAFMTWLPVTVDGQTARITSEEGTLVVEAREGVFQIESLEKACKENHKDGVLSRLYVDYPAAAHRTAQFTMSFEAN